MDPKPTDQNFTQEPTEAGVFNLSELLDPMTNEETEIEDNNRPILPIETEEETEPIIEETLSTTKETEVEETVIPEEKNTTDYKNVIKSVWGDDIGAVLSTDEEGNEVETLFEDMEVDESTAADIIKSKLAEIEETYKSRVSIDDVSDFTKRLIDIESNGGDYKEAVNLYNTYQDPLESLDLENENDQIKVIVMRNRANEMGDEDIRDLIDSYKIKGILKERSETAKEDLTTAIDAKLDQISKEASDRKEKHNQDLKVYKTNIKTVMKDYTVKEATKSRIISATTKMDEDGRYEIDKIYNEVRRDPVKIAELSLFLLDKEAFLQKVGKVAKTEQNKSTLKTLKMISNKSKTTVQKDNENKNKEGVDLSAFLTK